MLVKPNFRRKKKERKYDTINMLIKLNLRRFFVFLFCSVQNYISQLWIPATGTKSSKFVLTSKMQGSYKRWNGSVCNWWRKHDFQFDISETVVILDWSQGSWMWSLSLQVLSHLSSRSNKWKHAEKNTTHFLPFQYPWSLRKEVMVTTLGINGWDLVEVITMHDLRYLPWTAFKKKS